MEATNQTEEYLTLTQVSNEDLAGAWTDSSGAKYSQDRKRLLSVPRLENYEVADGTEIICDTAFNNFPTDYEEDPMDPMGFTFNGKLKKVRLPSSIIAIGNGAFSRCDSLKELNLPDNVKYIGESAFESCYNIQRINIPSGITTINNKTFSGCKSLEEIDLPEGLNSIGDFSFSRCKTLRQIKLPAGLVSIGESAFEYCNLLQSVEIPSSVKEIGDKAFNNCTALNQIFLPNSLNSVGSESFPMRNPNLKLVMSKETFERFKGIPLNKVVFR